MPIVRARFALMPAGIISLMFSARAAQAQPIADQTAPPVSVLATGPNVRRIERRVLPPTPNASAAPAQSQLLPASGPRLLGYTQVYSSGLPPDIYTQSAPTPGAPDREWLASLTLPNLPVRLEPRVLEYLRFYRDSERGRAIAQVWAKRRGRYVATLRAHLALAQLPSDLVWLSLVESGHDPGIRSRAGALGLWQFMPGTARLYGLTVDRWLDERLDPERSTIAALKFLRDLRERFGNWALAMAAYNMGPGGLGRAIQKYNTNDYWQLGSYEAGLPYETSLYVPKIAATAILMSNLKAFGLADITPDTAEGFDTVLVPSGRSLAEVARACSIPLATLKRLNPQLLAGRTPPARAGRSAWRVHVPLGSGHTASTALAASGAPDAEQPRVTRFAQTLEGAASDPELSLIPTSSRSPITPTSRPLAKAQAEKPRPDSTNVDSKLRVVVPPKTFAYPARRQVFYEVRVGDTLQSIARAFRVTSADIFHWNSLDPSARLFEGLTLQMFVAESTSLAQVSHASADEVFVLTVGSQAFFEDYEQQKGRVRLVIAAKPGDTLARIGRRHGIRAAVMERINQRARYSKLQAMTPVVLYVKAWRAAQSRDRLVDSAPQLPDIKPLFPDLLPGDQRSEQAEPAEDPQPGARPL